MIEDIPNITMKNLLIFILGAMLCLPAQGADPESLKALATYKLGDDIQLPTDSFELARTARPGQYAAIEKALMGVLAAPDATQDGKSIACRLLQLVGSDQCVPAVSALLTDDILSHYGRMVLERIASPKATAAIRESLDKASDKVKPGLVGSLGVLRDSQSVKKIGKLAADADPAVTLSAIQAFGKIGGPAAAKILTELQCPDSLRRACNESLITCAASLKPAEAARLYEKVYSSPDAICRIGALDGLIQVEPKKALAHIKEILKGADAPMIRGALGLVASGKGGEGFVKSFGSILAEIPAPARAKAIVALGDCGHSSAISLVVPNLADPDPAISSAAVQALGKVGNAGVVKQLLAINDPKVADAIAKLTDPAVDKILVECLKDKALLKPSLEAVAERATPEAFSQLIALTADSDADVKAGSWKGLKAIAIAKDELIVPLAKAAFATTDQKDQEMAFSAVKNVCLFALDKNKSFEAIVPYYDPGSDAVKLAILDIGSASGSPSALEIEKRAIESGNPLFCAKAVRSLATWSNSSAAPVLLSLASKSASESDKIIALRGYIQIASGKDALNKFLVLNPDDRCAMLKSAAGLAVRPEEKILILSGLRTASGPALIPLLTQYINDPQTNADAKSTVNEILKLMKDKASPQAQELTKLLSSSAATPAPENAKPTQPDPTVSK